MKQISSVGFEFGTDQALHHTIEKVFKPVNTAWSCPVKIKTLFHKVSLKLNGNPKKPKMAEVLP
jgi:hypothetical protein